jgi:hypothetical protein
MPRVTWNMSLLNQRVKISSNVMPQAVGGGTLEFVPQNPGQDVDVCQVYR